MCSLGVRPLLAVRRGSRRHVKKSGNRAPRMCSDAEAMAQASIRRYNLRQTKVFLQTENSPKGLNFNSRGWNPR